MKKLRKAVTTNKKLVYYAVGEYGSETQRPHFHSILFNLLKKEKDSQFLEGVWKNGHVHVGDVTGASMAYVTGYLQKHISREENESDDREKEKSFMSKGIGHNYITPARSKYYKRKLKPFLTIEGGQKLSLPRYYKDKIFTEEEKTILGERAKNFIEENDPFGEDYRLEFEWKKDQIRKIEKLNRIKRLKL